MPRPPWRRWRTYALGALALATVLGAWAFWFEPRRITVRFERLALEKFPPLRVAVLSDLHAGGWHIDEPQLAKIVQETNALQPDLVLIAGDFVQPAVGEPMDDQTLAAALARLRSRFGTYAVFGNHDRSFDGRRLKEQLESAGISVLFNSSHVFTSEHGRFALAGIDDEWNGRPDPDAALTDLPEGLPVLMLMHNPDAFPRLSKRISLCIAGHTHGGQVRFPLYGAPVVPSRYGQRYAAGLIEEEGRKLFVTSGLGTSILPVRFGVPPEIALLELGPPGDAPNASVSGSYR